MSADEPLKAFSHKFLGGSVNLSPATTFPGKNGQLVSLPDRVVLKNEGAQITLTAAAIDALVQVTQMARAKPFLDALREAEQNDQED